MMPPFVTHHSKREAAPLSLFVFYFLFLSFQRFLTLHFSIKLLSMNGAAFPPSVNEVNNSLPPAFSTCHSQKEGRGGEFVCVYFHFSQFPRFLTPIFQLIAIHSWSTPFHKGENSLPPPFATCYS